MAKLKEALPKLDWKKRWDNNGVETSAIWNSQYGKGDIDDDAFVNYPAWIYANFVIDKDKVFHITSFMWLESNEPNSGYWRFCHQSDGVIPFYAPGTRSAAKLDKENLKNLLETLHDF